MSYYRLCPECGAALDPGEVCDCRTNKAEQNEQVLILFNKTSKAEQNEQVLILFNKTSKAEQNEHMFLIEDKKR